MFQLVNSEYTSLVTSRSLKILQHNSFPIGLELSASIISQAPVTNLFNIFDLEIFPYEEERINSQEVVDYCEAHFRVALQEIMRRRDADQEWMMKILLRELVL